MEEQSMEGQELRQENTGTGAEHRLVERETGRAINKGEVLSAEETNGRVRQLALEVAGTESAISVYGEVLAEFLEGEMMKSERYM